MLWVLKIGGDLNKLLSGPLLHLLINHALPNIKMLVDWNKWYGILGWTRISLQHCDRNFNHLALISPNVVPDKYLQAVSGVDHLACIGGYSLPQ